MKRIIGLANPFRRKQINVIFSHKALHGYYLVQKRGKVSSLDMLNAVCDQLQCGLAQRLTLDPSGYEIVEVF